MQDISTARFVLAEQGSLSGVGAASRSGAGARGLSPRTAMWIAVTIAGTAAVAVAVAWQVAGRPATPGRTARFALALGNDVVAAPAFGALVVLSPDGSSVVYVTHACRSKARVHASAGGARRRAHGITVTSNETVGP